MASHCGAPLLPETRIEFQPDNPKLQNSAAYKRYDSYKQADTVGKALQLGASRVDVRFDLSKGFAVLMDAPAIPISKEAKKCKRKAPACSAGSVGDKQSPAACSVVVPRQESATPVSVRTRARIIPGDPILRAVLGHVHKGGFWEDIVLLAIPANAIQRRKYVCSAFMKNLRAQLAKQVPSIEEEFGWVRSLEWQSAAATLGEEVADSNELEVFLQPLNACQLKARALIVASQVLAVYHCLGAQYDHILDNLIEVAQVERVAVARAKSFILEVTDWAHPRSIQAARRSDGRRTFDVESHRP